MTMDTSMASAATATEPVVAAFLRGATDEVVAACTPDVLVDINVPTWRFQLQGRDALHHILTEEEFPPGRTVGSWRSTPTADGHLLEVESHAPIAGEDRQWRELVWFRHTGEAVSEVTVFCSGVWDAATIARHAAEAPMVTR